jgi:hypothetical protein
MHCQDSNAKARIHVTKEGSEGHVKQWELVDDELHVWIQSRNPTEDEEVTLAVVKLYCG